MTPIKQAATKDSAMETPQDIPKDTTIDRFANPGATASAVKAPEQSNSLAFHLKGLGIVTMDDVFDNVSDSGNGVDGGVRLNYVNECSATDDEDGVKTQSAPAGRYQNRNGSKDSSKPYSPGAYGNGDFVRHGAGSRDDDPFSSPSKKIRHRGNGNQRSVNTTPTRRLDLSWRSGSSDSSHGDSSPTKNVTISQQHSGAGLHSKEAITGQNAQAFYPPSACVFVANLLQTQDEVQLEYAVTKVFSKYGPVFVKIRRDDKNMPYAFCQYTTDQDAARAIQEGRGQMIHGRPCRTERAKANRVYWISRKDGHEIPSKEDALAIAKQYGELDDHWTVNSRFQALNGLQGLHPGFFVQYTFYENGRDAQSAMRAASCEFALSTPHLPYDGSTPRHGNTRISPRDSHCRHYLSEYAVDRKSVFVGNLPNDLTNAQIAEMFAACGEVIDVKLHHMPSTRPGCEVNVFAFIQFSSPIAVRRAIGSMNGFMVNREHTLRVKQKDSNHSNSTRGRRSIEQDHSQNVYHSPSPARLDANSTMVIATPMQGYQYSNGTYPPTPVSHGFPTANYAHSGYSAQQWQQMSPMQLGVSPPAQNYWPGCYQYPAYPGFGYQFQYPTDYSTQAQQQCMQMGYGGYGYAAPATQYSMDPNGQDEVQTTLASTGHEESPITTEQDTQVTQ